MCPTISPMKKPKTTNDIPEETPKGNNKRSKSKATYLLGEGTVLGTHSGQTEESYTQWPRVRFAMAQVLQLLTLILIFILTQALSYTGLKYYNNCIQAGHCYGPVKPNRKVQFYDLGFLYTNVEPLLYLF
jgi:hypothetical protein